MDPDGGACGQCRQKKAKCSLVPRNAETGKADRHHYTQSEVLEYRLGLLETDAAPAPGEQGAVTKAGKRGAASAMEKQGVAAAKRKAVAKGKQPASPPKRSKRIRGSPEDDNEPGASDPAPSPSISLAALETLALESGGSSATNIAADSPATPPTLPKLRLPKRPALTAPEGSHTSQHSGKSFLSAPRTSSRSGFSRFCGRGVGSIIKVSQARASTCITFFNRCITNKRQCKHHCQGCRFGEEDGVARNEAGRSRRMEARRREKAEGVGSVSLRCVTRTVLLASKYHVFFFSTFYIKSHEIRAN